MPGTVPDSSLQTGSVLKEVAVKDRGQQHKGNALGAAINSQYQQKGDCLGLPSPQTGPHSKESRPRWHLGGELRKLVQEWGSEAGKGRKPHTVHRPWQSTGN